MMNKAQHTTCNIPNCQPVSMLLLRLLFTFRVTRKLKAMEAVNWVYCSRLGSSGGG
jgi:hypothetical protein